MGYYNPAALSCSAFKVHIDALNCSYPVEICETLIPPTHKQVFNSLGSQPPNSYSDLANVC